MERLSRLNLILTCILFVAVLCLFSSFIQAQNVSVSARVGSYHLDQNKGSDCGFKSTRPIFYSSFDDRMHKIWFLTTMIMDSIIKKSCDLHSNPIVLRAYEAKKGGKFCVGFVVNCGGFYGLRVVYPPSDSSVVGLMYAEDWESVQAKEGAPFPDIPSGGKGKIHSTYNWKKSDKTDKQETLIKSGKPSSDCTNPKKVKNSTYIFEGKDPFYSDSHFIYYFPVVCKNPKTKLMGLKHMYAMEAKGSPQFLGYTDIDVFNFPDKKKGDKKKGGSS